MKKKSFIIILTLCFSISFINAQNNRGYGKPNLTNLIVASDHNSFWLFIDDVLQNTQSTNSIKVEFIPTGEHYLRVEIDNQERVTIGQYINLSNSNNYYWIDNQRNMYGISIGRGSSRTDAVVNFAAVQRNNNYSQYDNNRQPFNNNYPHDNHSKPQNNHKQHHQNNNQQPNVIIIEQNQPEVPIQEPIIGMPDFDFQQALNAIHNESFEATKLSTAKQVLANNLLSVNQVISICKEFDFEATKLDFAKSAYHHCAEKEKYYLINSVFDYAASKNELNDFVSGQR